jgi:hypothetical protein
LALSSCALSSDGKSIIIGSWDNHVYVYSIEYGRVLDTLAGHDDAVSSLQLKGSTLVTCSWDSTLKVVDHFAAVIVFFCFFLAGSIFFRLRRLFVVVVVVVIGLELSNFRRRVKKECEGR